MLIKEIQKIPDNIFNSLKLAIGDKSIDNNSNLAGNIEEEYKLNKHIPILEKYLLDEIGNSNSLMDYMNIDFSCNTEDRLLALTDMWVNYQKKHEFNPVHNHYGVFSFIVFMQIPFFNGEQIEISPGKKSNHRCAGHLEFIHTGFLGNLETTKYAVDKTWEQKMLIFPCKLYHCVYPFYGIDDYRITISGNVKFKL